MNISITRPTIFLAALALLSLASLPVRAQIIADSVSEFSGTQGQNNWFYGYYNRTADPNGVYDFATDFQFMTQYDPSGGTFASFGPTWFVQDGTFWTSLYSRGGHPNGIITTGGRTSVEHWNIRRYISEVLGLVNLSGVISKLDSSTISNGINGLIFVDGSPAFSQYIAGGDTTGVNYNLNATVSIGSIIDFAIAPFNSDDRADTSRFTATVSATPQSVPEPGSVALLAGMGTVGAAFLRRRKAAKQAV